MRVLASTTRTQGQQPYDVSAPVEGELVRFATRDGRCPDNCPNCSCTSVMVGFASGLITTTFTVLDVAGLDAAGYAELLFAALVRDEEFEFEFDLAPAMPRWVREWADDHLAAASRYPVDAVLELRNGTIHEHTTMGRRAAP